MWCRARDAVSKKGGRRHSQNLASRCVDNGRNVGRLPAHLPVKDCERRSILTICACLGEGRGACRSRRGPSRTHPDLVRLVRSQKRRCANVRISSDCQCLLMALYGLRTIVDWSYSASPDFRPPQSLQWRHGMRIKLRPRRERSLQFDIKSFGKVSPPSRVSDSSIYGFSDGRSVHPGAFYLWAWLRRAARI